MDFSLLDKPEVQFFILKGIGAIITSLVGTVIYFVKSLIKDVKKATRAVTMLTLKFDNFENEYEVILNAHRELIDKLHGLESDVKVLERSVLNKKRDNGSRNNL